MTYSTERFLYDLPNCNITTRVTCWTKIKLFTDSQLCPRNIIIPALRLRWNSCKYTPPTLGLLQNSTHVPRVGPWSFGWSTWPPPRANEHNTIPSNEYSPSRVGIDRPNPETDAEWIQRKGREATLKGTKVCLRKVLPVLRGKSFERCPLLPLSAAHRGYPISSFINFDYHRFAN